MKKPMTYEGENCVQLTRATNGLVLVEYPHRNLWVAFELVPKRKLKPRLKKKSQPVPNGETKP